MYTKRILYKKPRDVGNHVLDLGAEATEAGKFFMSPVPDINADFFLHLQP